MQPQEMLAQLKLNASTKICETLDSIYAVCNEQLERGVNDFSIATIARLGQGRGVPKAQSMRNKTGEPYRALIQSFADVQSSKIKMKPRKIDEDWIDEIENPKHKLLARIQASELRAAQRELREIVPPNSRINIYDYTNAPVGLSYKLTDQEQRALTYLISPEFQKTWGFKATEFGELVDQNNKPVFKAATIDAIKKALEHLT
jgi:hypothetical protein